MASDHIEDQSYRDPEIQNAVQFQEINTACCCPRKLSWVHVSVIELLLMIVTVVFLMIYPHNFLKDMVNDDYKDDINLVAEWSLRFYAAMIISQIALLVRGLGWGNTNARKTVYWSMLFGDIALVVVYLSFIFTKVGDWTKSNIAAVVLASFFGLFRLVVLSFNPRWWVWYSNTGLYAPFQRESVSTESF